MMEAYLHGVSTRKVDDPVQALGVVSGVSKSEVSRIYVDLARIHRYAFRCDRFRVLWTGSSSWFSGVQVGFAGHGFRPVPLMVLRSGPGWAVGGFRRWRVGRGWR